MDKNINNNINNSINNKKILIASELKDLIPSFISNRKNDLHKIEVSIKNLDYSTLERVGHTLIGSCGCYGFDVLKHIGENIEKAAKEKNIQIIKENLLKYKDVLENYIVEYV